MSDGGEQGILTFALQTHTVAEGAARGDAAIPTMTSPVVTRTPHMHHHQHLPKLSPMLVVIQPSILRSSLTLPVTSMNFDRSA